MNAQTEKQVEREIKRKLLIVDDDPDYLDNGMGVAKRRGYETEIAQNLGEALKKIEMDSLDGVITDMQFPGASPEQEEILKAMGRDSKLTMAVEEWVFGTCRGDSSGLRNSAGYFVIQQAKKLGISVVPITSIGHGPGTLIPLIKDGVLSLEEMYRETRSNAYEGRRLRTSVEQVIRSGFSVDELKRNGLLLESEEKGVYLPGGRGRPAGSRLPYCFSKSIVCTDSKDILAYSYAIDILEGKIDKTRPYELIKD